MDLCRWLIVVGLVAAACSDVDPAPGTGSASTEGAPDDDVDDNDDDDDGPAMDDDAETSASTGGSTDPAPPGGDASSAATGDSSGGPQFLVFDANVDALTVDELVVFTAVLTDPDGVDDLIGGVLQTVDDVPFGSFATASQEGSYELTLTWDDIVQTVVPTFDVETTVTFEAVFYDQSGTASVDTLDLTLHCGGVAACAGVCVDLATSSSHCGACGNDCDYGCSAGECWSLSACMPTPGVLSSRNCDEVCEELGLECKPSGCGGDSVLLYADLACAGAVLPQFAACSWSVSGGDAEAMRCCCGPE